MGRTLQVEAAPQASRVTHIYMAVIDDGQGGESVFTLTNFDGVEVPMVAINPASLEKLHQFVEQYVRETGRTVSIISFTGRNLSDMVPPSQTGG